MQKEGKKGLLQMLVRDLLFLGGGMEPFAWLAELGVEEASPLFLCMTRMSAGFCVGGKKEV